MKQPSTNNETKQNYRNQAYPEYLISGPRMGVEFPEATLLLALMLIMLLFVQFCTKIYSVRDKIYARNGFLVRA